MIALGNSQHDRRKPARARRARWWLRLPDHGGGLVPRRADVPSEHHADVRGTVQFSSARAARAGAVGSMAITRLVHVLAAPIGYAFRPYIVYRTREPQGASACQGEGGKGQITVEWEPELARLISKPSTRRIASASGSVAMLSNGRVQPLAKKLHIEDSVYRHGTCRVNHGSRETASRCRRRTQGIARRSRTEDLVVERQ